MRHRVSLATCLLIFHERTRNIEFAKSIFSNDCRARRTAIERSERAQKFTATPTVQW